jgi:hypothetical protein
MGVSGQFQHRQAYYRLVLSVPTGKGVGGVQIQYQCNSEYNIPCLYCKWKSGHISYSQLSSQLVIRSVKKKIIHKHNSDVPRFEHGTHNSVWAGIAQSVQRLATGWTVRRSNSGGGKIFRTRPDRPWRPSSLLYNGYRVLPGGKAARAWR